MKANELTKTISKSADLLNIKKWDFGASFSNDYSVQVDRGKAKQLKASQKQIITLRVWNTKNLVGITTTSDFSETGIKIRKMPSKNKSTIRYNESSTRKLQTRVEIL